MVVTGIGAVSPNGIGTEAFWSATRAGRSGVSRIEQFDVSDYPTRIAGQVRDFRPEDHLSRIFDAFYQIDAGTTRSHGGAGLGLSIVKQLVDGHGGKIEVTSALGEGTIFTVTLPAADANA